MSTDGVVIRVSRRAEHPAINGCPTASAVSRLTAVKRDDGSFLPDGRMWLSVKLPAARIPPFRHQQTRWWLFRERKRGRVDQSADSVKSTCPPDKPALAKWIVPPENTARPEFDLPAGEHRAAYPPALHRPIIPAQARHRPGTLPLLPLPVHGAQLRLVVCPSAGGEWSCRVRLRLVPHPRRHWPPASA
jgi:hypothetical protein